MTLQEKIEAMKIETQKLTELTKKINAIIKCQK